MSAQKTRPDPLPLHRLESQLCRSASAVGPAELTHLYFGGILMFKRSTSFRGGNRAWRGVAAWIVVVAAMLISLSSFAHAAIIGSYVDAKAQIHPNGGAGGYGSTPETDVDPSTYSGPLNTTPSSAFSAGYSGSFTNNLWDDRGTVGVGLDSAGNLAGPDGNLIEGGPTSLETVPIITTTVTGLPANNYDVYVLYWSVNNADWSIRAKLSTDASFVEYDDGAHAGFVAGTDTGISVGTVDLYEAKIGTVTGTSFAVDVLNTTLASRTWYDGVAFVALPEPASLGLFAAGGLLLIRRRRCGR